MLCDVIARAECDGDVVDHVQINVDCATREQTALGVQTGADRQSFVPAQKRVHALMQSDPYRRFIESQHVDRRHPANTTTIGKH